MYKYSLVFFICYLEIVKFLDKANLKFFNTNYIKLVKFFRTLDVIIKFCISCKLLLAFFFFTLFFKNILVLEFFRLVK